MAQMAPALAEAAGSPSSNADISSSTAHEHLRLSKVEEEIKQDKARLHINSGSLNHNGICRSVPNSKTTKSVSCVMEKVHRLNKLPYTRQKSLENSALTKPNSTNHCPSISVENSNNKDENHPHLFQKETLASTPTRITTSITTTKTCASNLFQNLSSCDDSVDEIKKQSTERHPVATSELSVQELFDKKVRKLSCNQKRLISHARKLERRLRTLQTKQLESHVSEQLTTLSTNGKRNQTKRSGTNEGKLDLNIKTKFSRSTSHKDESSTDTKQQISAANLDSDNNLNRDKLSEENIKSSLDIKPEVNNSSNVNNADVARSLVCQLEVVENVHDSDATECSSGGESCDEMETNETSRSSDCVSQFYTDRGCIASRWAWLRSQVIDIERRIRRCEETYKSVRSKKIPVQLDKQKQSLASRSADELLVDTVNMMNNIKDNYNNLKGQKADVSLNSKNSKLLLEGGYKEKSIINNVNHTSNDHNNFCTAARTRPLQSWQKRKLFSLSQLQKSMPNVYCSCTSPLTPCVLCQKNCQSLPILKSIQDSRERVSVLDLSFHPVLSFETDIPLSLHFGALLKKGQFQSKIFKLSPPKIPKITKRKYVRSASSPAAIKKAQKTSLELAYKKQGLRALHNRKKTASLPNTPKNKERSTRLCKTDGTHKKRPAAVNAGIKLASQLQKRARALSLPSSNSRPSSPVLSGVSPTSLGLSFPGNSQSAKRKKLTSNAFDINNIVIPYSMASTTRVEKLQYKEIVTPAWRELVVTNDSSEKTAEDKGEEENDDEDLSNLTFALRHMKCEEQERKRFLGMAIKKKKRALRQSSEATTPEPVSPGSLRLLDGTVSTGQNSSGVPSPSSSNPPSLNSSLNLTSPTTQPVVNMLPHDSVLAKFDRSGKSGKHINRRSSSVEQGEDSNESWPVVAPWPLREFPLSENDEEDLVTINVPPPSPSPLSSRANSPMLSPVASPDSTANTNWTVKVLTPEIENPESDAKPPRKGIVLKLAKR